MRFLIDENMARSCSGVMREMGYEAFHVSEIGLTATADEDITGYAIAHGYIIITFDLDFSRIVALSSEPFPSVITFRTGEISLETFTDLISKNLPSLKDSLKEGALATLDLDGVRIQRLPILRK